MTQTAVPPVLTASNPADLLKSLKDLKNGVIGNTWKKVEVAEDESVIRLLLGIISGPVNEDRVEFVVETAVIIGALANVGALTIRPLLSAGMHTQLFILTRSLLLNKNSYLSQPTIHRLLPPLLRAIRNLLVTTADLVWGHMWGVGAEKKVVATGLGGEGMEVGEGEGNLREVGGSKGKGAAIKGKGNDHWRLEAIRALSITFEQGNLSCLMLLLYRYHDVQILLPLYQLFARLIALPSHREALARWAPPNQSTSTSTPSIAGSSPQSPYTSTSSKPVPFILTHLLDTITTNNSSSSLRRSNGKILEASLDLLAAVIKGQPKFAQIARRWNPDGEVFEDERDGSGILTSLMDTLVSGPTAVRIAAANCVTNILRADKGQHAPERVRAALLSMRLLEIVSTLLRTEGLEERVKICFILGTSALTSDQPDVQKCAFDKGIPKQLVDIMEELNRDEQKGGISGDLSSRSREAILLALASLSFLNEQTRAFIAEANPPFLPHVHKSLSHPSYGVRAAACQLTRALSRGIAILRTSLVDSGIGEEIVHTLRREHALRKHREAEMDEAKIPDETDMGERAYTVEVAATATICNLITDFSPLQAYLLRGGGIDLLCELAQSPFEPLAQNALWAIKNLVFHAPETLKSTVMTIFGWPRLKALISPITPLTLRVQALEIIQNLTADALPSEIAKYLELLGENEFLSIWVGLAREAQDTDLRVPALYVMSNLALGNEKVRGAVTSHVEILEVISESLNAKADQIKVPAIRTLRHLIVSNAKSHRPRQTVLDLLQPYHLKSRLKELAETSPSLDVCHGAVGLLEVLEKGREGGQGVGSVPK